MPRYGDAQGVTGNRAPHHLIRERDIVPRVPPRWAGYANPPIEYDVHGQRRTRGTEADALSFVGWMANLATATAVKDHRIEGYRKAIDPAVP